MATVYMLCGQVASGKTTLAARLAEKGAMVLSCDELMLTLFDHCLGPRHRETESRALRFLERQAAALYHLGVDTVLDHGFWYRKDREEALAFFEENHIPVILYHVTAPPDIRRSRLLARNETLRHSGRREYVLDEDMQRRFDAWFEPPLLKERAIRIETQEQGETTDCDGEKGTGAV